MRGIVYNLVLFFSPVQAGVWIQLRARPEVAEMPSRGGLGVVCSHVGPDLQVKVSFFVRSESFFCRLDRGDLLTEISWNASQMKLAQHWISSCPGQCGGLQYIILG